ncbi:unknown [Clostridium sp. CAG:465]|nr:unknown [Clostridium sp. CAG:465]
MSEKQNIFESLKEDTKELDKMKNTIERLKEDLNILNVTSNNKED